MLGTPPRPLGAAWRRCKAVALLLGMLCGPAAWGTAPPKPANIIVYVRPVVILHHPLTYDICLYSTTAFPMNDSVPALSVGKHTFVNSRYLQGSTLNYLVFRLTQSQFLSLHNGDPAAVSYNQDDAGNPNGQWNFGSFQSSLLPKKK